MDEAWVSSQRKAMTRWINSMVQDELVPQIDSLERDLSNGLALYALVNSMLTASNSEYSTTKLTPLYKTPKFKVQKVENVADVLEFLRVALQVNVCNISAENIVEGDSKLVLGFVWSLYMYSSTATLSKAHEDCNSFHKIKRILMDWVNSIINKRDLRISNFDRDWSIQENRPDLILWAILDHYAPVKDHRSDKKMQNLQAALERANALGINLSDIDDYLVLVCDEQCIVTNLLEWFKYFEIEKRSVDRVLDLFIEQVVGANDLKREYDAAFKRYHEKIKQIGAGMNSNLEVIESDSLTDAGELLRRCCSFFAIIVDGESDEDMTHTLDALQCIFQMVESAYTGLSDAFGDFETYGKTMKPQIIDEEYEQLTARLQLLQEKLLLIGTLYEPTETTSPQSLMDQLATLSEMETKFVEKSNALVEELLLVQFPAEGVTGDSQWRNNTIQSCLAKFQSFDKTRKNLQEVVLRFDRTFPLDRIWQGLSVEVASKDSDDIDYFETKMETEVTSELQMFDAILNNVSEDISVDLVSKFLNLIPLRVAVGKKFVRSESDFTLHYPLDESDDSNSVFDGAQKSLGSQLTELHRVYDVKLFLDRLRHGFRV